MNSLKYFTSPWCGPCRIFKPIIQELKSNSNYKITIIDSESDQESFFRYGVGSVPTLIFEDSNENIIARHVGAMPKEDIEEILSK